MRDNLEVYYSRLCCRLVNHRMTSPADHFELNEYQLKLAKLYRESRSPVVVVAPCRKGTTTALIDIVTQQKPAVLIVIGRRAERLITTRRSDLDSVVHRHDPGHTDGFACTVVDTLEHRDVLPYIRDGTQTLIVLNGVFTPEEARRAPVFFGRVRQLTKVNVITNKLPPSLPNGAESFMQVVDTTLDDNGYRMVFSCSFTVMSIHTFGSTSIGDDPLELVQWAADLGNDIVSISTRYCCKALDIVYIVEPERVAAVAAFVAACELEWSRLLQQRSIPDSWITTLLSE